MNDERDGTADYANLADWKKSSAQSERIAGMGLSSVVSVASVVVPFSLNEPGDQPASAFAFIRAAASALTQLSLIFHGSPY